MDEYDNVMGGDRARAVDRLRMINAERAALDIAKMMRQNQAQYYVRPHIGRVIFTYAVAFVIVVIVFGFLNYVLTH